MAQLSRISFSVWFHHRASQSSSRKSVIIIIKLYATWRYHYSLCTTPWPTGYIVSRLQTKFIERIPRLNIYLFTKGSKYLQKEYKGSIYCYKVTDTNSLSPEIFISQLRVMTSIAASLWDSIFMPGPTPILVKAMNLSFFALFILLIPLAYYTQNIHVALLTILAIGLWAAMQWYHPRCSINTGFWWSWRKKNNNQYRTKASNASNVILEETRELSSHCRVKFLT